MMFLRPGAGESTVVILGTADGMPATLLHGVNGYGGYRCREDLSAQDAAARFPDLVEASVNAREVRAAIERLLEWRPPATQPGNDPKVPF